MQSVFVSLQPRCDVLGASKVLWSFKLLLIHPNARVGVEPFDVVSFSKVLFTLFLVGNQRS